MLRFGQPVGDVIDASGLHFKAPFVDNVVYIDRRILALDDERQEVLVAENQRLEVDAFVRYRIVDPLLFYQSVGTVAGADAQLGGMLNSALRRTLSEASILDIVRNKRDAADGRHPRPDEERRGAFRPRSDRRADQARRPAGGELGSGVPPYAGRAAAGGGLVPGRRRAQAQKIRADADRDATVIRATARQKAEQLRGEGDGERNRIFAEAYRRRSGFLRLLPLDAGL